MATRAITLTPQKASTGISGPDFAVVASWSGLLNGDDGAPVDANLVPNLDRSFQVTGTFGAGGTLVIEGTNDGTNWATLTDPQGVAASFTATGIKQITEVVLQMRPRVTAGDGTTVLAVTAFLRRTYNG